MEFMRIKQFIHFAMKSLSYERSGYQLSSAYELNGFEWHTHTHKPVDRTKERFSKLITLNFIMNFTHSLLLVKLKFMHKSATLRSTSEPFIFCASQFNRTWINATKAMSNIIKLNKYPVISNKRILHNHMCGGMDGSKWELDTRLVISK